MVYGVSRIALPSADCSDATRVHNDPLVSTNRYSGNRQAGSSQKTEDFVAGPENALVVSALQRIAERFGSSEEPPLLNPLVLVGPSGYGKSHLARGIVRLWTMQERAVQNKAMLELDMQGGPSSSEYLRAIDFARQLRTAREEGLLDPLRNRLANLHLLVIEDLQNLPKNTYVQRELRDNLDVLFDTQATIVITTNKPLASIEGFEPGLRDRLNAGLTIRLQPPGFEARQEVLRIAAEQRGLTLAHDQLLHLAQTNEGTVPQLLRLLSQRELISTVDSATDLRKPLKFKQILAVVARYFSLTQAALCSPARRKSLVYARAMAIHLARSLTDLSYAQIGQHLGSRDHTTIMHASQSIRDRITNDTTIQQDIEELRRILTAV